MKVTFMYFLNLTMSKLCSLIPFLKKKLILVSFYHYKLIHSGEIKLKIPKIRVKD